MPLPDSPSARALGRWVDVSTRRWPWVLLAALVVTGAGAAYVASNLGVQTDLDAMLDPELPFRRAYQRYEDEFPQFARQLVLVVDARTPEDARAAALAVAEGLEAKRDVFAHVSVPRAEPFLEAHGLLFLDEDELYDLSDRLARVQPFLGRLTRDPSLRGLFDMLERALEKRREGGAYDVSPLVVRLDETLRAVLEGKPHRMSWQALMAEDDPTPDDVRQYVRVQVRDDVGSVLPAGVGIREARALFDDVAAGLPGAPNLRITGAIAMEYEELMTVRRGAESIGLLTLVLVGLALAIGLRSWRLVAAALVALAVGLVLTAAFATFAVGHLNLISVAFGVLYIGLGVDYAIHLALRYREAAEQGRPTREAIGDAARDVGGSLLLCTVTTAIGFYAFVPTAYRGVSELGLISGTGMFVSLAVSLTLLPALFAALPLRSGDLPVRTAPRGLFAAFVDLPLRRRRAVLGGAAVLALAALAVLPRAHFDLNPLNLRDPNSESVATFRELVATSETPPWSIQVLAEDLEEVARVRGALEELETVDEIVTIGSFVASNQADKQPVLDDMLLTLGPTLVDLEPVAPPDLDEVREATRDLRAEVGRYVESAAGTDDADVQQLAATLDAWASSLGGPDGAVRAQAARHGLLDTLPATLGRLDRALRARPYGEADLPPELRRDWVSASGVQRIEVFPSANLDSIPALRRFSADVRGVAPDATGAPVTIVESGNAIVGAFRQALIVSVVACTLVLLFLLRRPGFAALVLVPLLFAGAVTGAATVLLGVPFNFANVIALPLLFGIGVDSGIHVVHRAHGTLPPEAGGNPVRTSTGRAVVFSALTTICSFGSLAFSPHPGTASMGLLLAVGVTSTLFATLWLLPALAVGTKR